jgi:sialidase-1
VKAAVLSQRRAGYSDLVQVGSDTVGVLYETGVTGTYDTIEFRRVSTAELGGG